MIKRYELQFVKAYDYKDDVTGDVDKLIFKANGRLLPLFKSISGESLEIALDDYRLSAENLCKNGVVDKLIDLANADDAAQRDILVRNPNLLQNAYEFLNTSKIYDNVGMTFIDLLMICMYICAQPLDEEAAAIAMGKELLPREILTNATIFSELLGLAFDFMMEVKKK